MIGVGVADGVTGTVIFMVAVGIAWLGVTVWYGVINSVGLIVAVLCIVA